MHYCISQIQRTYEREPTDKEIEFYSGIIMLFFHVSIHERKEVMSFLRLNVEEITVRNDIPIGCELIGHKIDHSWKNGKLSLFIHMI